MHFNIILPSTPRSSEGFLSFRFSDHHFVRFLYFPMCFVFLVRPDDLPLIILNSEASYPYILLFICLSFHLSVYLPLLTCLPIQTYLSACLYRYSKLSLCRSARRRRELWNAPNTAVRYARRFVAMATSDRWNRKKQGRSLDASRQVARSTPLYITLCFLVSRHVTVARALSELAKMCRLASILQLENRWTELYEIWYWLFSLKLIEIKMTKLLDIIHRLFFIKTQRFWMKARSELPALTYFV
jgi:hypothetical protein